MSDLDNEELYFTQREKGLIKDEDVEKAANIVRNITEDDLLNYWEGPEEPYNAIQTVLNELKYVKAELERQINARMITEEVIEKNYIDRKEIEEIRDKLEVMDYYLSEEALEDLNKVLGAEE